LGAPVVIYVDLVIAAPAGEVFRSYLGDAADRFAGVQRLTPNNIPVNYRPPPAHTTVITTVSTHIRDCAATAGARRVQVFLEPRFRWPCCSGRRSTRWR
jgi:hypothetical protein